MLCYTCLILAKKLLKSYYDVVIEAMTYIVIKWLIYTL